MSDLFSKRLGVSPPPEITVREDATEYVRLAVAEEATERGLGPHALRDIICKLVRAVPDPSNWSEYPNVWGGDDWASRNVCLVPRLRLRGGGLRGARSHAQGLPDLSEIGLDSQSLSYLIDALEGLAGPTDGLAEQKVALVRLCLYTPGTVSVSSTVKREVPPHPRRGPPRFSRQ